MAKAQAQMRAGVKRSQKPETLGHIVSANGSPIMAYKKISEHNIPRILFAIS